MALWKDLPGENTRINRKNLSRLEMYTEAICTIDSDYKVDFDGASGLDNNDVVKISFPTALDNDKQARLSIDNGDTYYDIETAKGKEVENKELELIFKSGSWEKVQVDIEPTVVVDNLNSTSATEVLSANMGRTIKNKTIGDVLWTGVLQGGANINLDVSAYDYLEVYVKYLAGTNTMKMDLNTTVSNYSGAVYGSGLVAMAWNSTVPRTELFYSEAKVSADKKTFYHTRTGYFNVSDGSDNSRTNNSYIIYKIVGFKE